MMLDADPVLEIEMVFGGQNNHSAARPMKRMKDAHLDLSTYLVASDDEYDAVVPSSEVLEMDVTDAFRNPFIGGGCKAPFVDAMITSSSEPGLQDLGDLSSGDEDAGYASMFNSPAHVLDAELEVPFGDSFGADALLVDPSDDILEEAVRALSAPSSPTPMQMLQDEPMMLASESAPPTPTADGKPPVNPTRWAHNSTERKRRLEIRKLFSGLRDLFPDIAGDDKISNITTLNRAIECVAVLKEADVKADAELAALRERNAVLKARAAECAALRKELEARHADHMADVPPVAAAVLEGCADPEVRKQLPAALRQLLDHNSRGAVEQKPLARRRKVSPVTTMPASDSGNTSE